MICFALATCMMQATPPDLALPVATAVALNDRAINRFPAASSQYLRGFLISDDGKTFFGRDGEVQYMSVDTQHVNTMPMYRRGWLPDEPAISSNQAGWIEASKGYDKAKQPLVPLPHFEILAAKDANSVVISYEFHPMADNYFELGVSEVSFDYGDPKGNRLIYKPKDEEFSTGFVPDVSSPGYLAEICKRNGDNYDVIEQRVVLGSTPGRAEIKPGYSAFLFDSVADAIVCWMYTEQGSPYGFSVKHLKSESTERVTSGVGRLGVTAMLPGGRILASCEQARGDEEKRQYGLYECDPPYKTPKFLGPYILQGASRNGHWLVVSHRDLRRSWLISLKS
jgi:hypothetical protein